MKLHLNAAKGINQVRRYENGCITIDEQAYCHSVIVLAQEIILWRPTKLTALQADDWRPLLGRDLTVILLGCGDSMGFPDTDTNLPLIEANIGLEVMNNAAACRTFNYLIADGRHAGLAILLDNPL